MSAYAGPANWWTIGTNVGRTHIATKGIVQSGLLLNLDASVSSSYSGSGTSWTDLSGNGRTGTLTNGPTFSSTDGGSILFAGASSTYVSVGNIGVLPSTGTIIFWMKSTDVANWRNPFSTHRISGNVGFRWEQATSGTFAVVAGNDAGSYTVYIYTTSLSANTWYMVSLTWNTSTNTITGYLNGTQVFTSSTHTQWATTTATDLALGSGLANLAERYFTGHISNAQVYNVALTAAQILQNHYAMNERLITNVISPPPSIAPTNFSVEYLVVAGGGGGATGGGGGGGLLYSASTTVSKGTSYTVTVGAGGTGGGASPTNGGNSVFASATSVGGGAGGVFTAYPTGFNGSNGGSGGGGGMDFSTTRSGGSGTASQGNAGGTNGGGYGSTSGSYKGGGGGGAGAVGGNANTTSTGSGGNGLQYSISGTATYYAGGGGGGLVQEGSTQSLFGAGGLGGGASGGGAGNQYGNQPRTNAGTAGVNTGGGGGGNDGAGTAGGSGVVILKIPNTYTASFSVGVTQTMSTAVAGFKIYTITAAGTTDTVTFS